MAEKLGIPAGLVRQWLADNHNAELLDEIVPLWPNIGSARQYAKSRAGSIAEPRRIDALSQEREGAPGRHDYPVALAGVRPTEGVEEEKPASLEQQRPAVLLNLFLGSSEQPIRTVSVVDVSPTLLGLDFLERVLGKER